MTHQAYRYVDKSLESFRKLADYRIMYCGSMGLYDVNGVGVSVLSNKNQWDICIIAPNERIIRNTAKTLEFKLGGKLNKL